MKRVKCYGSALQGAIACPPSKSLSHRGLICAALAEGESIVENLIYSVDIEATMSVLRGLGATFTKVGNRVHVQGVGGKVLEETAEAGKGFELKTLECHESGSTLRFMIPVGAAVYPHLKFEGKGRLVERPIHQFFDMFEGSGMGYHYDGKLPLETWGSLKAGTYAFPGDVSSQFISGVILAAPLMTGETVVKMTSDLESKAYVDLTLDVMRHFGIDIHTEGYEKFAVVGKQAYKAQNYMVEGDYSQVAFWVAGATMTGRVALSHMNRESAQGDREVLDILTRMGGKYTFDANEMLVIDHAQTVATVIDARECPDIIPVMAVLAALSEGETVIQNGERLRIKESDRITATVDCLKAIGADVTETSDGMIIRGVKAFKGGVTVSGHNDHRIVMAMAIAALRCQEPIVIEGWEAISKSYPHFFEDYKTLGGLAEFL